MAFFMRPAHSAHAGEVCETFDRETANIPSAVQTYFTTSGNFYVEVCRSLTRDLEASTVRALGATIIFLERDVCEFTSYPLSVYRWHYPSASLRQGLGDGTRMMMIRPAGGCPGPFSGHYTATYGVSGTQYSKIMSKWRGSLSSEGEFDDTYRGITMRVASESDLSGLRSLVATGVSQKLRPFTISRTWHFGIVNRYEIAVLDPKHIGQVYEFIMTEWGGWIYSVSQFGIGYTLTERAN